MKKLLTFLFPEVIKSIKQDAVEEYRAIPEYCSSEEINEMEQQEADYWNDLQQQEYRDEVEFEVLHNNTPVVEEYPCKEGEKIHIKSKRGIYEVVSATPYGFEISCNTWKVQNKPNKFCLWTDFKCLAGGNHNI